MLMWTLAIGAGVIVLAGLLYFFAPSKTLKTPAIVTAAVGGVAVGAVGGLLASVYYGDSLQQMVLADQYMPEAMPGAQPSPLTKSASPAPKKQAADGAPAKKKGGGGGGGGGGGPGGYGGGYPQNGGNAAAKGGGGAPGKGMAGMMGTPMMTGPNPKNQLNSLVAKLDLLTRKPLAVSLTDEQKAKIREQLKGLADAKDLNPIEAKKRLDAILDVLKNDKATLEAAGFEWPSEKPGPKAPTDWPNPFTADAGSEHLKGLLGTLGDAKPK